MFSRVSALLVVAIAFAASARHIHVRRDGTSTDGQCSSGTIQCCNAKKAGDVANLLSKFSFPYDPTDNVWINCTPFNWGGAGESAVCEQQPVCCQNNTYKGDGSVFVGCSPFNVN